MWGQMGALGSVSSFLLIHQRCRVSAPPSQTSPHPSNLGVEDSVNTQTAGPFIPLDLPFPIKTISSCQASAAVQGQMHFRLTSWFQNRIIQQALKITFNIHLHLRLNCLECPDSIASFQGGTIIIFHSYILKRACWGYALALHATFDSMCSRGFDVPFHLCDGCCGGDGIRQSALISSVCPQTQPCVAAAVSSPPARWAIASICSRKILSWAMCTSKPVAVAGHRLCLPACREEKSATCLAEL